MLTGGIFQQGTQGGHRALRTLRRDIQEVSGSQWSGNAISADLLFILSITVEHMHCVGLWDRSWGYSGNKHMLQMRLHKTEASGLKLALHRGEVRDHPQRHRDTSAWKIHPEDLSHLPLSQHSCALLQRLGRLRLVRWGWSGFAYVCLTEKAWRSFKSCEFPCCYESNPFSWAPFISSPQRFQDGSIAKLLF